MQSGYEVRKPPVLPPTLSLPNAEAVHELRDAVQRCLAVIEDEAFFSSDVSYRICLTILEDELYSLLEECEAHIRNDIYPPEVLLSSLQDRSHTVFEEVRAVLGAVRI